MAKILVVDDEEAVTNLIGSILKDCSHEVVVFNSSKEALNFCLKNSVAFDLAFIDYNIPDMNGLELAKQIRQQYQQLPFVFITGFAHPKVIEQTIEIGAVDFLEKPFDEKTIEQTTEKILYNKFDKNKTKHNFITQFIEILDTVVNNKIPYGFSSVDFIIKTLKRNQADPEIIKLMKDSLLYLSDQINYLEAIKTYSVLKENKDKRQKNLSEILNSIKKLQ